MKTICYYELGDEKRSVKSQSLADFRDGFWLDGSLLLADKPHERRLWIPPARILHVERVK